MVASHYPLVIIPFATSIVLVIGSPEAEPAQPRALIGGHVVTTLVGLVVLQVTGAHAWAAGGAVGLAVLAMYVTGTFHPPAGINPLLVVSNSLPWSFLFVPVLAGAVLLTAFAYLWHRWIRRRPWAAALVVMPAAAWRRCYNGLVITAWRSCPGPAA
jgi:CBS-domain-containing membrane protein